MAEKHSLKTLKRDIDASIDAVAKMPTVVTGTFSSETLKARVIWCLLEAKNRIAEIEAINSNIDAVGNEIIRGVSNVTRATARPSLWLSLLGLVIGVVGVSLTIYSFGRVPSQQPDDVEALVRDYESTIASLRATIAEHEAGTDHARAEEPSANADHRLWYSRMYLPRDSQWHWWVLKIAALVIMASLALGAIVQLADGEPEASGTCAVGMVVLGVVSWLWF